MRQDVNTYIYVAPLSAVVAWARKIKIKRFFAVCFSISRLLHIDWLFLSLPERKPGHNCLLVVPFVTCDCDSSPTLSRFLRQTWNERELKRFSFSCTLSQECVPFCAFPRIASSLLRLWFIFLFLLYAPMSTFSITLRAIFSLRTNLDTLPFAFSGDCR